LVILFAGGFFAWQYFGTFGTPKKEVVEDKTADWKTYGNEKYGFEIKYPGQFALKTAPVPAVGGTNDMIAGSFGDVQGEIVVYSSPYQIFNVLPVIHFVVFPSVDFNGLVTKNLEEYVESATELRNREDQVVKITSNATYAKLPLQDATIYKSRYCVYDNCFETEAYVQNKNDDIIRFNYSDELCMQYEGTTCTEKVKNSLAEKILSTLRFLE